jgi:flagellar hook-length control protein FliK
MKVDLALFGNMVQSSSNNIQVNISVNNFLNVLQTAQTASNGSTSSVDEQTVNIDQLFTELKGLLEQLTNDLNEIGTNEEESDSNEINIEEWILNLSNLISQVLLETNTSKLPLEHQEELTSFDDIEKMKIFFGTLSKSQIKEIERLFNTVKDKAIKNDNVKIDNKLIEITKVFEEFKASKNNNITTISNPHKATIIDKVVEIMRELDPKKNDPNSEVKTSDSKTVLSLFDKFGSNHQLNRIQQFSIFTQTRGNEVNTEGLIKQFENILSSSILNKGTNLQKLVVKLYPESLGSLRIEILQNSEGITAKIQASTQQAKQLIDSNIQNLKSSLLAQNINIEKLEVTHQLNHLFERGQPDRENLNQQNQNSRQNQNNTHKQDDEETSSFESFLNDFQRIEGENNG